MGQNESKQKLQQITESIERIRKDVRTGKITGNDVEKIQGILQKYSREIAANRNIKVRKSDIYTLETLIEITSKEIDALKEEVNLDQAAVSTNSFSRATSRNSSKSKRKSVKSIVEAVENIKHQIRNDKIQNYDQAQADLVKFSQELSSKKGQKQEIDRTQKLISSVTKELLTKQQQSAPDNVSVKSSTNSLSRRSEKRVSIKEPELPKEVPNIANKNTAATLEDIETKLQALKYDITVAESNKDKNRLRFLAKSIQTLMTDLQMVNVKNQLVNEEKKILLEKNLQHSYKQIEKIKRDISTENNLKYLVDLEKKQKKERYLEELSNLHKILSDVDKQLNNQNYQKEKENLVVYKNKLDSIEEVDQDVSLKKSEISDFMLNVENAITKLEMEDRLNQAEWRHCQYKIDLKTFSETTDNEMYKKHRQYLSQLREYVSKILEVSQKVGEKKKYVLYNIDNNIAALDKKARENEEKLKKEEANDEIVLRNITSANSTNRSLVDNLLSSCNDIPTNCSSDELKNILPLLLQARSVIDQKLILLQNQNQIESDAILVRVKTIESEPSLQHIITEIGKLQNEVAARPEDEEIHVFLQDNKQTLPLKIESSTEKDFPEKTTKTETDVSSKIQENRKPIFSIIQQADQVKSSTKEEQLNKTLSTTTKIQLENIQKEIEAVQAHIEKCRYTKETQFYEDMKNKLENFKSQIKDLLGQCEDSKFGENLLKYVDNVAQLLDNNLSNRKSTTEDILVEIMSVSSRVNELGSKIQDAGNALKDYQSIKHSLLENKEYIKSLQISPNRKNLYKSRDEIVQQIDRYLAIIDDLRQNGNSSSEPEEKVFNQELRKLKEKVSRYTGTYKNVLYKTIENDLDKHLSKVDSVFKDSNVAQKVKRDIENCKLILEQKSSKDQNYRDVSLPESKELAEIRQNIDSVRKELNQAKPLTKEELDRLDARLTLSILALDNIKDEKYVREKEKLYQNIHDYFAQIQDLMLVSKPHSVLVEDLQQKQMDEEQQAAIMMGTIEKELEIVKNDILTFVGTETNPKFLQLDEVLVRGTLKLDELNIDTASPLYSIKVKLMRDIHKYSDILDERINETEEIEKLENDVKVMLMKIDSFNGYFGDPEYTFLDEEIIKLKVHLGKLHVNQELIARREACMRGVDICMKKLNEAAKPKPESLPGTLV